MKRFFHDRLHRQAVRTSRSKTHRARWTRAIVKWPCWWRLLIPRLQIHSKTTRDDCLSPCESLVEIRRKNVTFDRSCRCKISFRVRVSRSFYLSYLSPSSSRWAERERQREKGSSFESSAMHYRDIDGAADDEDLRFRGRPRQREKDEERKRLANGKKCWSNCKKDALSISLGMGWVHAEESRLKKKKKEREREREDAGASALWKSRKLLLRCS